MRFAIVLLALVASAGCDRTDELRSVSPPYTPASSTSPAPEAPARCVIALPPAPPPAAGPADRCPPDPEASKKPSLPTGTVTFVDAPSRPSIRVELAVTTKTRTRGLMYRTELDEGAGMLFSWPDERIRSFWMHNTCLPLDMLFIAADGTIVGILEQVPTLNDDSRRIPCPAAHVLEVNAGYSRRHGVRPGQKLLIDSRGASKGAEP